MFTWLVLHHVGVQCALTGYIPVYNMQRKEIATSVLQLKVHSLCADHISSQVPLFHDVREVTMAENGRLILVRFKDEVIYFIHDYNLYS